MGESLLSLARIISDGLDEAAEMSCETDTRSRCMMRAMVASEHLARTGNRRWDPARSDRLLYETTSAAYTVY
jgi:hypothetical protein